MTDLYLTGLTDAQKRLFAVRSVRRVQRLMTDPRSVNALDVAERHARGEATDEELKAACAAAWGAVWETPPVSAARYAAEAAWCSAAIGLRFGAAAAEYAADAAYEAECEAQHEIFKRIREGRE